MSDPKNSIVPVPQNRNPLSEFQYGNKPVRTVIDGNGDPWFVAADVCAILDLDQVSRATSRLDDDEKGVTTSNTLGGNQQMATINESGLYSLILTSRKPEAKAFKKWITAEVLPALRKTGSYQLAPLSEFDMMRRQIDMLEAQRAQLERHETRLDRVEARQTAIEDGSEYFTVLGYAVYKGIHNLDYARAAQLGKQATTLSKKIGLPVGRVRDPRFGEVNTYHQDILDRVLGLTDGADHE